MELQAAILLVVSFALLLMFSVPVSYSIVASAFITITAFLTPQFGMFVSAQKVIAGIDSLSLIAVPFFILAGLLMSNGGIAHRLVDLAMLVLTNAAGNAMFGSISGSGIAAATAIGGVMLPMEKEEGYDEGFSAAMNVATAPVGQLIPPTTAFIVYSTASGGTSVATLFMAGWIPGLLWTAACMVVGYFIAKKYGYIRKGEKAKKLSASETLQTIWRAIPSLLLIVIIIGGILSGVFSPTEASAVAVAYAFILSVFIYKSIDLKDMPRILVQTANMTTVVMLIIGASSVLSFVLSFTGLPAAISKMVLGISDNKYVLLLILNIFLLIVGTFMDMAPALLIFTPIFLPIVRTFGMSDVQFGVMMVMNLAVGTITPPVGNVLFVGCSLAKQRLENVMKSLVPFFVAIFISLMLVTYIPALSEWLPTTLGLM